MGVSKEKARNYKSRAFSLVLAFAMVLSSFVMLEPVKTTAAETTQRNEVLDFTDTAVGAKWRNKCIKQGNTYVNSGESWSWNAVTKTFRMQGLDLDFSGVSSTNPSVKLPTDSKILLAANTKNTISFKSGSGIESAGALTIVGGGRLVVKGVEGVSTTASAIKTSSNGALSITERAHVTAFTSGKVIDVGTGTVTINDSYLRAYSTKIEQPITASASPTLTDATKSGAEYNNTTGDEYIAIGKSFVLANGISLTSSSDSMMARVGSVQMSAKTVPENTSYPDVTWSVESTTGGDSGARISESGVLTAEKAGIIRVTAVAQDDSAVFASKLITVNPFAMKITDNEGKEESLVRVPLNQTKDLDVKFPEGTNYQQSEVRWSVDKSEIATIDGTGLLKPLKIGRVNVKAEITFHNSQEVRTVTQVVDILDLIPESIKITTATQGEKIPAGEIRQMLAEVTPVELDSANKNVNWTIENPSEIAEIGYTDGILKTYKPGKITVRAQAQANSNVFTTIEIEITDTVADFNSGNYSYSITNPATNGNGTVTLKGFAKGKSATTVSVPSTVKNAFNGATYKVTAIKSRAFYKNKKITKATLGKNVTTIGSSAFSECSKLKEVTIYDKTTTIKKYAFYKNYALKKVTIGKGLKTMESNIFKKDTNLRTLIIKSKNLKKIGKDNLKDCKNLIIDVDSSKVKAYTKLLKNQGQKQNVTIK